jgi:ribosome production factor 1
MVTGNKARRQALFVRHKLASSRTKRKERFARRKEEDKNPELRRQRQAKNQPATLDKKRVWDDVDEDSLGAVVDVAVLKRRRLEQAEAEAAAAEEVAAVEIPIEDDDDDEDEESVDELDNDLGSMLDSDEDREEEESDHDTESRPSRITRDTSQAPSLAPSTTSTNMDLTPAALAEKFPTLFIGDEPHPMPKVLITTSLNSTLHDQARVLCNLFPNSQYVRRTKHRFAHKYSVREIAKFAANRGFTTLVVLKEDQKKPTGLDIVHLPHGPSFQFSISNFVEGKRLAGHGNSTGHYPELLLTNFRTPLGLLTAKLFQTLFPAQSEIVGRTVVAIINRRDYLFLRRYRYVYRDKRDTEKEAVDANGKPIPGGVRVGLQILGPNVCAAFPAFSLICGECD